MALALITVLVVTVAIVIVRMDQQNRGAISQQLAARAHELIEANPRASALFAIAAWDTSHTLEAREAVLGLLNNPLKRVAAGDVSDFASNDAGNFIAIVDVSGEASVRDISGDISVRDTGNNGWHSLTSDIGKIHRIAFGAGVTLAAAGERGIEIWTDPEHNPVGKVVSNAVAERNDLFDLAFAGWDLQTLYAPNRSGVIQRWRAADGESAGPPISVDRRLTAIAAQRCIGDSFKGKQCLVATADDSGNVELRDADTGAAVGGPIEAEPSKGKLFVYDLAFSPDGDSLAIASDDQRVHLWSISQNKGVGSIDAHSLPVRRLAFAPDRKCSPGSVNACVLATVAFDSIRVWDVRPHDPGATTLLLARFESQGYLPMSAAFINNGDSLVANYDDGSLVTWNVGRIAVDGAANDLAFDPAPKAEGMVVVDGRGHINLMSVGREGSISVSKGARARNLASIAYGPNGGRWAAAGDGKDVYVSDSSYNSLPNRVFYFSNTPACR